MACTRGSLIPGHRVQWRLLTSRHSFELSESRKKSFWAANQPYGLERLDFSQFTQIMERLEFAEGHDKHGQLCFFEDGEHVRTEFAQGHKKHGEVHILRMAKLPHETDSDGGSNCCRRRSW